MRVLRLGHAGHYATRERAVREPFRRAATYSNTMNRITGSLVVCVGAGVFTAGALFREPQPRPNVAAPAVPAASGTVTYGNSPAGSPAGNGAAPATLEIADFSFRDVTASPGATINLVNRDGADHTVTADDGAFDVAVAGGSSGSFAAPTAAGTYAFFCAIHPAMQGTLVVR
jgi:plastocyanin